MATDEGQEQGSGPGERLRRAREAMGRSPEDMSEELRLSVDQVRSLEAEAFHRLPGEAYVRGYLRNYAAAVGVPPEEIIAAYEQLPEGGGEAGAEEESPLVPAPERPLIEHPWRVVWVSLALLVVVTVVTLWLVGESRQPALPDQSASSGSEETSPPGSPNSEEGRSGSGKAPGDDGNGEVAGGQTANQGGAPAEGAQEPSGSESPVEKPAPEAGNGDEPESEPDLEKGMAAEEGTDTESQTAANSRPEGTALTGPGLDGPRLPELPGRNGEDQQVQPGDLETLRVHTWADSWLEVADDRGRTLLRRLVKEGRDVRLYGEAPFQVKVGNAAGVQLYFEGQPLTPLGAKGEVVALNVDGDSPTIPESEVVPPGEGNPAAD